MSAPIIGLVQLAHHTLGTEGLAALLLPLLICLFILTDRY